MDTFVLGNSILVNLDFTLWTGRAKLDITEVPQAASLMPPKELYNSGSIKIFDTDKLKVFRNFKTRADLCCAALGLKARGFEGWLVDENNINQLEGELVQARQDWDATLDDFVAHYPYAARDWANSCGKWDTLIAAKQPSEYEIRNRFNFGWWTVRITPESTHAGYGNTTNDMIADIPDQALQSVIDSLTDLYNESFNKSGDPSPKAYNALKKIAQRARALGFANPNAARLAPVLLDVANQKNHTLSRLVLSRMDNPQNVLDVLQTSDSTGIDSLLWQPAQPATPPAPSGSQTEPVSQPDHAPNGSHDVQPVAQDMAPIQSQPDLSVTTDSLLERAKQMLNNAPPLTSVNHNGDIIRTDTNEVVMSAQEVAEVTADIDLAAEKREMYDQGIITRSELVEQLAKLLNEGKITEEQYDKSFPYKQPEPVQPAPAQPLNSMDVLDSLGLF